MGYETNKPERKAKVEEGGWVVAWADDVSETDAITGVVAAGVSIYAGNPAPFLQWVEALVQRTIDSLINSAQGVFPNAILGQVKQLAADTIKSAVSGKSAKEVLKEYDTVDFKAGAIKYEGKNTAGGVTISTTWGIKPYVAFRWRGSGPPGSGQDSGNTTPSVPGTVPPVPPATVTLTYTVTIKTGVGIPSGTGATAYITLHGKLNSAPAILVPPNGPLGRIQPGSSITVTQTATGLGDLKSITLQHDNSGISPDWHVESVYVKASNGQQWAILVNKVIGGGNPTSVAIPV